MTTRTIINDSVTGANTYKLVPTGTIVDVKTCVTLQPKLSFYKENISDSNGSVAQNIYARVAGTFTIDQQVNFTYDNTTNKITYTGADAIIVQITYAITMFSSADNQLIVSCFLKNDAYGTSTSPTTFALPNYPVGYVPMSAMKQNARNLTAILTTTSTVFTTTLNNNDTLRLFCANITAGNNSGCRDLRVSIITIGYL